MGWRDLFCFVCLPVKRMVPKINIVVSAVLLAGLLCAGCAIHDGSDSYAQWETYTDPQGRYSFKYLAPPWRAGADSTPDRVTFIVQSEDDVAEYHVVHSRLGARLVLEVEVSTRLSAEELAIQDVNDWEENSYYEVFEFEEFSNMADTRGIQVWADAPDRTITAVYLNLLDTGAVVMRIAGRVNVDCDDVDLLLRSLEPHSLNQR
jgi:hypothetical protein